MTEQRRRGLVRVRRILDRGDPLRRHELPIAIADLNLVLKAAVVRDKAAFSTEVDAYISDMIPAVTGSLDDVDPTVTHN